jgi:hypothetical protein
MVQSFRNCPFLSNALVGIASSNLARSTKETMYSVRRQTHPQYGSVVEILREETGTCINPFQAEQQARKERRLWQDEKIKARFLIDNQILALTDLEKWSHDEYQSLPKCQDCGKLLCGEVFSHSLADSQFFCSQSCADNNYHRKVDHLNDCEECDL